jgi:hypothetical protein
VLTRREAKRTAMKMEGLVRGAPIVAPRACRAAGAGSERVSSRSAEGEVIELLYFRLWRGDQRNVAALEKVIDALVPADHFIRRPKSHR